MGTETTQSNNDSEPFSKPITSIVDEAHPNISRWRPGSDKILFENYGATPFKREDLECQLQKNKDCLENITRINIHSTSMLTSMWIMDFFPNAKALTIEGEKVSSLEALKSLQSLRYLWIDYKGRNRSQLGVLANLNLEELVIKFRGKRDVKFVSKLHDVSNFRFLNWPEPDLISIQELDPRILCFSAGILETCSGLNPNSLNALLFDGCSRLKDVSGLRVPNLQLESCNNLDLDTLSNARNLQTLKIAGPGVKIESLGFLKNLKDLEEMTINAKRVIDKDLSILANLPKIKKVWISPGIPDEELLKVSKRVRGLRISNFGSCFSGGQRITFDEYYEQ